MKYGMSVRFSRKWSMEECLSDLVRNELRNSGPTLLRQQRSALCSCRVWFCWRSPQVTCLYSVPTGRRHTKYPRPVINTPFSIFPVQPCIHSTRGSLSHRTRHYTNKSGICAKQHRCSYCLFSKVVFGVVAVTALCVGGFLWAFPNFALSLSLFFLQRGKGQVMVCARCESSLCWV